MIIVTGATGQLGRAIVERLVEATALPFGGRQLSLVQSR